jgi:hypothetical protein
MTMQRFEKCRGGAVLLAAAATVMPTPPAWAWGHTGHVLIGQLAIYHLPQDVPSFVRSDQDPGFEGELAAEPDVSKNSGDKGTAAPDIHDAERDPGHFINMDDAGFVAPVVGFPEVPQLQLKSLLAPGQTRGDFDTLLREHSGTTRVTQYNGYLPYNIVDGWEQIRKDFAYVRAFGAAIANDATPAEDRAFFRRALHIRKILTLRDIGVWAHFVGDASQPLHVSIHFNGWSTQANPQGFTNAPIHAPFEGYFVKHFVTAADIAPKVGPYRSCETVTGLHSCPGIEPRVRIYLQQTLAQVVPLYALTKSLGGDNPWLTATPADVQKAFVVARLAAGASELRDEIVDAWHSSDTIGVGYPLVPVADIESGKIVWSANAFAGD